MPIILVTAKADPDDIVAGPRCRRRRVHHQARRPRRAGRAGALDPAHQGAARHGAGAGGAARGVEPHARAARRGPARRDRAARRAQAVPVAAGRRARRVRGRASACSRATAARSPWCSATCAASPPSPRPAEPEEVMGVLRQYHEALGRADLPPRGHARALRRRRPRRAVQRSAALPGPVGARGAHGDRDARAHRRARRRAGAGRATSSASASASRRATPRSGTIGFEGRYDYAAIGPVANLASRLCDEAARRRDPGQPARARRAVEGLVEAEPAGELALKGFARPVAAYRIRRSRRRLNVSRRAALVTDVSSLQEEAA